MLNADRRTDMKKTVLAIVMTLVAIGAPLFAAEQPPAHSPLKPGDRVRVRASTIPTEAVGEVVEAAPNVLTIRLPDRPDTIEVPIAAVTRLQRSLGTHKDIGKSALIGGLIGAGAGVAFVAFASGSEGCEGPCGFWALVFGAVGGGAGALVGTGVGAARKTERWERIPVGRVGLSVVPERRGGGVALSVRF
jgi:hypothetical protein